MINKTTEYDIFIFRDDNREKIDQAHVLKLVESIKSKNMLDLCPILVNEEMEIIDGQHRVLAAKMLKVPIYYTIEKNISPKDIILLNISKNWTMGDHLNFYCKHNFSDYIKLKKFMETNNLSLKVSLNIIMGEGKNNQVSFKKGEFKFESQDINKELDICWDTISMIRKLNGYSAYVFSARFWKSLLRLVKHPDFRQDKWIANVGKQIDHFGPKATQDDYHLMFSKIYNWRNGQPIDLSEG